MNVFFLFMVVFVLFFLLKLIKTKNVVWEQGCFHLKISFLNSILFGYVKMLEISWWIWKHCAWCYNFIFQKIVAIYVRRSEGLIGAAYMVCTYSSINLCFHSIHKYARHIWLVLYHIIFFLLLWGNPCADLYMQVMLDSTTNAWKLAYTLQVVHKLKEWIQHATFAT